VKFQLFTVMSLVSCYACFSSIQPISLDDAGTYVEDSASSMEAGAEAETSLPIVSTFPWDAGNGIFAPPGPPIFILPGPVELYTKRFEPCPDGYYQCGPTPQYCTNNSWVCCVFNGVVNPPCPGGSVCQEDGGCSTNDQ
jgi:hypothetical protein